MKKLYIIVPMERRDYDDVKYTIESLHSMAEIIFGEKLEVIKDSLLVQEDRTMAMYYMSTSLMKMKDADYVIGAATPYSDTAADLKKQIAKAYGLNTYIVENCDRIDCFRDMYSFNKDKYK